MSTDNLSRGISDPAPLLITLQLSAPVGAGMWRLSRSWIMDPKIQEELPEALCNYWLFNDSANPLVVWDAFKAWLKGRIYHTCCCY